MIYAEFYNLSTGWPSYTERDIKPIPACGSDSVLILDGRLSLHNMINEAQRVIKMRGNKHCGFTINKGESFSRSRAITGYIPL